MKEPPAEKSIKYTNSKSRWSIILRYLLYQIACILVVEAIVGVSLLDHSTIKQIVLYVWPLMLPYIVVPVLLLSFWYGGSRVISIEYDDDSKTLHLLHYNWLLQQKQKDILLSDLKFRIYHVVSPFLLYRVVLILISDTKRKRTLAFTSGLGWKWKQVDEIADKLKEIKEPVVDW